MKTWSVHAGLMLFALVILLFSLAVNFRREKSLFSMVPHSSPTLWALKPCLQERHITPYPLRPVQLRGYRLTSSFKSTLLTQVSRSCRAKIGNETVRIHALRLRNIAKDVVQDSNDKGFYDLLLRSILDSAEYERLFKGVPLLFDTVYGAGYRTRLRQDLTDVPLIIAEGLGGMTHVDKVLSTLGELGIPLSMVITTHNGSRKTLADVLEDSLKRWYPARECQWSLLAYCDYLRGQRQWTGMNGSPCSIDQVLESVLKGRGACFGTHRLYGLAKACARERLTPGFFDLALIRVAETELRRVSQVLTAKQHAGGFWEVDWDVETKGDLRAEVPQSDLSHLDPRYRLHVTGHMLEWLAISEEDLRPPDVVIHRAVNYIEDQLRRSPEAYLDSTFLAAATHAVRALCNLSEDESSLKHRP